MLGPDSLLKRAYHESLRSIEAAQDFIRTHADEKDLCAGALLNMAGRYDRQGKKKEAIATYQRAIDEYADQMIPEINMAIMVKDAALFDIGKLERDIGNRDKALEIFRRLMTSSDFHTRTGSRIEYLATKQSQLKVIAQVAVQGDRKVFSIGNRISVAVSVENPTKETVTFMCCANLEHRSYRALAPREGSEEITLAPGARREMPMVFTEIDTKGLAPGFYQLTVLLTGIPFETGSKYIEIQKGTNVTESTTPDTYVFSKLEPPNSPRKHMIQRGESLSEIAVMHGVSADELAALNNIQNPDKIIAGQELVLPESKKETLHLRRDIIMMESEQP